MKTKLKKLSKRTVSIILSVVMLVSMAVVGMINASAYTVMANTKIYLLDVDNWGQASFHYWGNNWDELVDDLRDLNWIKTRNIHIIHEDLSYLPDKDLSVYLSIVYVIAMFWRQYPSTHHITFFFNPEEKERIDAVFRKEAEEVEKQYHLIEKLHEMKLCGGIDNPNSHSRI